MHCVVCLPAHVSLVASQPSVAVPALADPAQRCPAQRCRLLPRPSGCRGLAPREAAAAGCLCLDCYRPPPSIPNALSLDPLQRRRRWPRPREGPTGTFLRDEGSASFRGPSGRPSGGGRPPRPGQMDTATARVHHPCQPPVTTARVHHPCHRRCQPLCQTPVSADCDNPLVLTAYQRLCRSPLAIN